MMYCKSRAVDVWIYWIGEKVFKSLRYEGVVSAAQLPRRVAFFLPQ